MITAPAHGRPTSKTCIDHIILNFNNYEAISSTTISDLSDYFPAFAILKVEKCSDISPDILTRCYKNCNIEQIDLEFAEVNWENTVLNISDLNIASNIVLKITQYVYNRLAPFHKSGTKQPTTVKCHWLTSRLRSEI